MDKINSVMKQAGSYQGLRERAEQERPSDYRRGQIPTDHPVWEVWQSVKNAYPGGTINWDDAPPAEWAYAIEGLSPDQIASGLREMVQNGSKFPPNAPEFRGYCRPDDWEHAAQSRSAHEALNAPIIDKGEGNHLMLESDTEKPAAFGDFSKMTEGL